MDFIFLLIMALVPGLVLALYINLMDPKEKKPLGILFQSVFWGVLSFVISILLGILLHNITEIEPKNVADQMIRALIFVGFVEEGSKFIFIRGILFRSKHFYKPFDGIVFSVMVGMGFATAENIIYVLNGDGGTAIERMFTAVPAHAVFGVIMGYFIGEAKVFKSSSGIFSFMGLFFASFAHGYYDYFLFLSFIPGIWLQAIISLVIIVIITHYIFRIRKDEFIDPD